MIKFNHCGVQCWFNRDLIAGVVPSPELDCVDFIIYGERYTIHETFDEVMAKLIPPLPPFPIPIEEEFRLSMERFAATLDSVSPTVRSKEEENE